MRHRMGQVLIMGMVMVVVLAAVCVLTIDMGLFFCARAKLQNAADAGSLAAMLELVQQRREGASEEEARVAAEVEAGEIAHANTPGARVGVTFGILDAECQFVEQDASVEATAAQVTVSRDENAEAGSVQLCFAPLAGLAQQDVHVLAVARCSSKIMRVNGALRPLGVDRADIPPLGETMTHSMVLYDDEEVAPGCLGFLDFDGGTNSLADLEDWILNGYPGSVGIDPETGYAIVEGNTGFKAGLEDEFQQIVGQRFLVCVYDQVRGKGASGEFRIVSFLCVTLLDVDLTEAEKSITARVEYATNIHGADVGSVGQSSNLCRVQLVM